MGVKGNTFEGSYYQEEMTAWGSQSGDRSKYKGPAEVSAAAVDAMFGENPVRRYMVVPNENEASRTIGKAIEELVQLNQWQEYRYTREQLIEKLDAAMAPPAEAAAE
jgi:hypothetical protein